jgi:hypothetical protein
MGQSPSYEEDSRSADQKIIRLFRSPKGHVRVNKSPPLNPALDLLNPVHSLTSGLFLIFNIILPFTSLGLGNCLLSSGFATKIF